MRLSTASAARSSAFLLSVVAGLALSTAALAQTPPPTPPSQPPTPPVPAEAPRALTPDAHSPPRIEVHTSQISTPQPTDTRDARVDVGGLRISRPRFDTPALANTIPVPSNTLPAVPSSLSGESLQQRTDRIDAQNRILAAEASIAEEQARATRRQLERLDSQNAPAPIFQGPYGYPIYRSGGYGIIGGRRVALPAAPVFRGPITTKIDGYDDQIHAQAQKNFADAAAAGTGTLGNQNREAILNFGRVSTPPLIDQQRQRDQTQINLQKNNAPK